MTELEKLQAGLPYDFYDDEIGALKERAAKLCARFNALPVDDYVHQYRLMKEELLGSYADNVYIQQPFFCDNGKNIHVGRGFLTNYHVTILDVAPVTIGDHVLIGPNTLISTVNHPLTPMGRRQHLGIAKPVVIGNDVWIGGNVTILPGVTIGNNVVIAAGAVVTKNVQDNSLVGGVPAKVIRTLENDIPE